MSLQIIFGPMFSGKTSQLIDTINNYIISKKISNQSTNILVINNSLDNRNINRVKNLTTHSDIIKKISDENVITIDTENLLNIHDDILKNINFIAIDECQFFPDLSPFVRKMLDQKKDIICSGLIADVKKLKFGQLLDIFPLADNIIQLKSYCVYCKDTYFKTAAFTSSRKKDIPLNNNTIYVSAGEDYQPVCGKHYVQ